MTATTTPDRVPVVGLPARVGLLLGYLATVGSVSTGVGVLAGLNPLVCAEGVALVVAVSLCLAGPRARLLVIVAGAMVAFQSDFTTLKIGYLGLALICFALSVPSVLTPEHRIRPEFRMLLVAAVPLACYLAFTVLVSRSNGTSVTTWFRDVLPYVLLVLLPFVGIAAGPTISPRWNQWWFIVIGVVSSIGWGADWLNRRGVSALPVGRVVLSSTVVVALCFCYAITRAGTPGAALRRVWGGIALLMLVAMLLTGSRTNLVLLAGFAGVIGTARNSRVPPKNALGVLGGLVLALVVATPVAAGFLVSDPEFLSTRIADAATVLGGDAQSDASYAERKAAYDLTGEALSSHELLGTGPGHIYPSGAEPSFNLDAPGIVPAKLGLVGTVLIVAFLAAVASTVRRIRRVHGPSPGYTAACGWAVVLILLIPFGPWLEDKGFALAIAMMLASVIADARGPDAAARRTS